MNLLDGTPQRALSAMLFMQAIMVVFDAYSTLQSSPWTAENVGADEEKAASAREYCRHAVAVSMAYTTISTVIAGNAVPFIGGLSANIYLWWLYDRAIKRAQASGSDNWNRPMQTEAA